MTTYKQLHSERDDVHTHQKDADDLTDYGQSGQSGITFPEDLNGKKAEEPLLNRDDDGDLDLVRDDD